ncbi:MAG: hypothetical protein IIA68_09470 [Proteobacteria bacterium]|nr:hypothetical protein [Gemmatimonadota bacterium]MCH9013273.1 hypothetical protein [Pseudomonadota bacterium]
MPRTFEEKVGEELDGLYQAALFLCAGDRRWAEQLLVDTMIHAFRAHAAEAGTEPFERWLQARLVRQFLDRVTDGTVPLRAAPRVTGAYSHGAVAEFAADVLFRAAGVVPAQPRAALWLVLLRRWSYDDAARALGVERSTLKEFLLYRDLLLKEILGPTQQGSSPVESGS